MAAATTAAVHDPNRRHRHRYRRRRRRFTCGTVAAMPLCVAVSVRGCCCCCCGPRRSAGMSAGRGWDATEAQTTRCDVVESWSGRVGKWGGCGWRVKKKPFVWRSQVIRTSDHRPTSPVVPGSVVILPGSDCSST